MGLLLNKIYDPRDSLDKARRKELERLARKHGIEEIVPNMPAALMRKILRRKGIRSVELPANRYLGGPPDSGIRDPHAIPDDGTGAEVDALDALEAQWRAQRMPRNLDSLPMPALRKFAKEKGLSPKPSWKKPELIARLETHLGDAA